MAEYITKIRTAEGDKQIDYNALANLPVIKDYTEDILEAKADVESRIDNNSKRITNLEKGIPNECFVVDASISYKKDVPANALPYAEIEMVGGMTRKCANLIPYPYAETTLTRGGVTFTDNGDCGITLSGTATGTIAFNLWVTGGSPLPIGDYSLIANGVCEVRCYHADQTATTFTASGGTINISKPIVSIALLVRSGQTYNGTVYPMLNKGSVPLPYEPYFEGLQSAPVTEIESVGVNLIPYPYRDTTKTVNGITFTDNGDGTVTANGVATGQAYFVLFQGVLPIGDYFLFGKPKDGVSASHIYFSNDNYSLYKVDNGSGVAINVKTEERITIALNINKDTTVSNLVYKPMLNKGSTALPYAPYTKTTLPIPEEVQNLEGYGEGVNAEYSNCIKWGEDGTRTYHKMVKTITLDGVTYGKMMDGTDPQAAELASYYAYMLPAALAVESGTPCKISHGVFAGEVPNPSDYDVVANTSFVFSLSIKTEILGLGSAPSASEIVAATNKYLNDRYNEGNPVTVTYVLPSASREVVDISDILPGDNHIGVEGNGELTFVNEHGFAVPNEITYMLKEA